MHLILTKRLKINSVINKNEGFVASFKINKFYNLNLPDNSVQKVDKVILLGNLLKLDAFQTAGSFRRRPFYRLCRF
jgi:hypothetical protein